MSMALLDSPQVATRCHSPRKGGPLPDDVGSPAGGLVRYLVHRRGCALRAWRLDIDLRETGKVAYVDFNQACRRLGPAWKSSLIWTSLRHNKVEPMELHDLAEHEANNLEDFAETLWDTVGLDMTKAWQFFDANHQQYLTLEEFRSGCQRMGFEGDPKLLFRGLDGSGLGRMKRSEFEYLAKVSRTAAKHLPPVRHLKGTLHELVTWVQREFGGPQELLIKLGLNGNQRDIVVGDFAARLTALGFEGNALDAASKAARVDGGNSIQAESLRALLGGARQKPVAMRRSNSMPNSRGSSRLHSPRDTPMTTPRGPFATVGGWMDNVDNSADKNLFKCKYDRAYFNAIQPPVSPRRIALQEAPPAAPTLMLRTHSSSVPTALRWHNRPDWNSSFDHISQDTNQILTHHTRSYFSNPSLKPVRDQIRAKLEARRLPTRPIARSRSFASPSRQAAKAAFQVSFADRTDATY